MCTVAPREHIRRHLLHHVLLHCAQSWWNNKEITPRGQGQGRDFCRDFVQPSQVVQGDAAPPAGACSDCRASLARDPILPARGKTTSCGNIGRRTRILALSVQNASRTYLWPREFRGIRAPKILRARILNVQRQFCLTHKSFTAAYCAKVMRL